jgi:hypothetical protein
MNAKWLLVLLTVCAALRLTHARPAAIEQSEEEQSTWSKWSSIAFNWLPGKINMIFIYLNFPGVWRVFSNGLEKTVIIQVIFGLSLKEVVQHFH